jgi:hypothetical protein
MGFLYANLRKGQAMLNRMILTFALLTAGLPASAADGWTSLLDGGLEKWQGSAGGDVFRARAGTLTIEGAGQIVYDPQDKPLKLRSFELRAEVLTKPGGRAGLAFHLPPGNPRSSGGLEVRLDNSYSLPGPGQSAQKTGSLVWLRPVVKSAVPDGKWFPLAVRVQGRRVQVRVDDQLVVDYVEPEKWDTAPRLREGTVAVRGHGGAGAVLIRKLQVRPLPDAAAPRLALDATDRRLVRLREQGFTVIDFHTHLAGGLKLDGVLTRCWRAGVGAGVVARCGKGLPISDDKTALAFLKGLRGRPLFVGMLAEGPDWVRQFSPGTVASFDYVLADARTITDHRGRRVRLWVKDEVDISDPEKLMDALVRAIEAVLDREPIDVYANPTYLPEALAKDHDRLWTAPRMKRVVAALAKSGVALEINDRLRLPRPALIKLAREAGVKLAFGGGNADGKLGRLEYCLRMVEECALTPDDLWAPKPDGRKPIQLRKRR